MHIHVFHAINIFQGLIVVSVKNFQKKLLEKKNKRMRKVIITGPPRTERVLHIIIRHRKYDPHQQ